MEEESTPPSPTPSSADQSTGPSEPARNGSAVTALVVGIIGVFAGLIPLLFVIAWILGVLGIVFGVEGRARAKREEWRGGRKMATWGLVLGIVALLLGILGIAIVGGVFGDFEEEPQQMEEGIEQRRT